MQFPKAPPNSGAFFFELGFIHKLTLRSSRLCEKFFTQRAQRFLRLSIHDFSHTFPSTAHFCSDLYHVL